MDQPNLTPRCSARTGKERHASVFQPVASGAVVFTAVPQGAARRKASGMAIIGTAGFTKQRRAEASRRDRARRTGIRPKLDIRRDRFLCGGPLRCSPHAHHRRPAHRLVGYAGSLPKERDLGGRLDEAQVPDDRTNIHERRARQRRLEPLEARKRHAVGTEVETDPGIVQSTLGEAARKDRERVLPVPERGDVRDPAALAAWPRFPRQTDRRA